MSLLEDVFLQDEAGEAQELERIIEGDEYDERPRPSSSDSNSNSEKEDEAEEDKRGVEPASAKPKRVIKNPRVVLNPARLTGPRGIQVIPEHFKDFKFKGKGHEKEDLDLVLKKLEHWAYRLFPKFEFADCLKKIETLGNKRPVTVHLTKIRSDQYLSEDTVVQRESSDEEAPPDPVQEEDEFDKLLQQQIELARASPAPGSLRKPALSTPWVERAMSMPKATSSPSINDEQRERMIRNRQMAEERRLARLKLNISETNTSVQENSMKVSKDPDTITPDNPVNVLNFTEANTAQESTENCISDQNIDVSKDSDTITTDNPVRDVSNVAELNSLQEITEFAEQIIDADNIVMLKNNRTNVIDSSDEDDTLVINESVTVDIHSHKDDEVHSDSRNKNTDSVIEDEKISVTNDFEMNDINKATEGNEVLSRHDKSKNHNINEETEIPDSTDIVNNKNVEQIATSEINSDNVEFKSNVTDSNNFESDSNIGEDEQNKSGLQIVEEINEQEVEKENIAEDIMDVDFSEDF